MDLVTIFIRLVLAMALGGAVGIERQSKHRPAGFRTHILVCTGAALTMCLTEYMFLDYGQRFGISPDPFRLGAQVISGIGFLGAGTIINLGANVKGLTTAAALWSVACIGLAVGAGFYAGAVLTTALIMATLFIFSRVSNRVEYSGNMLELSIDTTGLPDTIGNISYFLDRESAHIMDIEFTRSGDGQDGKKIRLLIKLHQKTNLLGIIDAISSINGVIHVEKL